jgi:hypothetical protein
MNVRPEKQLEFSQTLLSMIEPTGNEAGCLGYGVYCDIEDHNRFSILEEWETREYLDDHIRSPRFGVLLGSKILLCEPPTFNIFTVEDSEGIEAVNAARKKQTDFFPGNVERSLPT